MFVSAFELFKMGIGPSSSHTMGPMVAACRFLANLRGLAERISRHIAPGPVELSLHGSLAFTGKGHATDRAVMLGLLGFDPATLDLDAAEAALARLHDSHLLEPDDLPPLAFNPASDLTFDYGPPLPLHANGLMFRALSCFQPRVWHRWSRRFRQCAGSPS